MRRFALFLTVVSIGVASVAEAQNAPASGPSHSYAEVVGGATFGHNTSGSFGAEVGVPYASVHFFAEGGYMRNVTTAELTAAADKIAQFLAFAGPSGSTVKHPVAYFAGGLHYNFPDSGRITPYVSVAVGGARVTKQVSFSVSGSDVTGQLLDRFGVLLGTDLSGSETKALVEAGAGAHVAITDRVIGDVSYRYGRIFLSEAGLNTHRLQVGIGIGF